MSISSAFGAVVGVAHSALEHLASLLTPLAGGFAGVLAIVVFTVLVRLLISPLTYLQIRAERRRPALAPELAALRRKHGDDKVVLATETLALQRAAGVGPFVSLLPGLAQAPFFMIMFRLVRPTAAVVTGVLAGTLLGVPLTAHLFSSVSGTAVFAGLLTLGTALAWWNSRRLRPPVASATDEESRTPMGVRKPTVGPDSLAGREPAAGQKVADGQKPVVGQMPEMGRKPAVGRKPVVERESAVGRKSAVGQKPVVGQMPEMGRKPPVGRKPVVERESAVGRKSAVGQKSADGQKLAVEQMPAVGQKPPIGRKPAAARKPPTPRKRTSPTDNPPESRTKTTPTPKTGNSPTAEGITTTMARVMPLLPYLTVAVMTYLPLAGAVYLLTSTAWTALEHAIWRRPVTFSNQ